MILDKDKIQELTDFRKEVHQHPEVSCEEKETAKRVVNKLGQIDGIEVHDQIGGTGVVAIYDTGKEGKTILFRAELDALPIQEVNDFEYRSTVEEVSHKCGHDGHLTILLGLVHAIVKTPPDTGRVVFLWQPAEENGEGAKAIMADDWFQTIKPDMVIAMHNLPGYVRHKIVLRYHAFTASVKSIIIKLHGKTSHAAEPENGINPAWPIWKILKKSDELSNNDMERKDFCVITPIYINVGDIAYGISAGRGDLRLTIRTWDTKHMNQYCDELEKSIDEICRHFNIDYTTSWTQEFATNRNAKEVVDLIKEVAEESDYMIHERKFPFKWGEDFGLFTQNFKGAMFGIGSGEDTPALHNPDYDFPDELIPTGIDIFHKIALKALSK